MNNRYNNYEEQLNSNASPGMDNNEDNFRPLYNNFAPLASNDLKKKRVFAYLIDNFLFSVSSFLFAYLFAISKIKDMETIYNLYGPSVFIKEWFGNLFIIMLLISAVYIANFILLPAFIFHGQSIGKKIMGIRIVNLHDESKTPGAGSLLLRELIGKQITSFFMIGVILFFTSKDGLAIHDKMFKTIVIDDGY